MLAPVRVCFCVLFARHGARGRCWCSDLLCAVDAECWCGGLGCGGGFTDLWMDGGIGGWMDGKNE